MIYLSYFLDENTPLYGGDRGVKIAKERSIPSGDTANTKMVSLNNHSGTHIDFPNHFFEDGKKSNDYDANFWLFNKVCLIHKEVENGVLFGFDEREMESIPDNTELLIIKTGFFKFRGEELYWKHNPGILPEVAGILRNKCKKLRAIGMDFISLTSYQHRETGRAAHREFLGVNDILLIEDMDLRLLDSSPSKVICLPLLLNEVDGSPVTIIADTK